MSEADSSLVGNIFYFTLNVFFPCWLVSEYCNGIDRGVLPLHVREEKGGGEKKHTTLLVPKCGGIKSASQ